MKVWTGYLMIIKKYIKLKGEKNYDVFTAQKQVWDSYA